MFSVSSLYLPKENFDISETLYKPLVLPCSLRRCLFVLGLHSFCVDCGHSKSGQDTKGTKAHSQAFKIKHSIRAALALEDEISIIINIFWALRSITYSSMWNGNLCFSGDEKVGRGNKKCCSKNFPYGERCCVWRVCTKPPALLNPLPVCGEASLHFPVNLIRGRLLWFHRTGSLTKSQPIYVLVESAAQTSGENFLLKETVIRLPGTYKCCNSAL